MQMRRHRTSGSWFAIMAILVVLADAILWYRIFSDASSATASHGPGIYFLNVGSGDAELIDFGHGVRVLIDAGPAGTAAVHALDSISGPGDRSLALVIISCPEAGDFGGLAAIMDRYRIGAVAYGGRDASPGITAWPALLERLASQNIPLLTLGAGDRIRAGSAGEIDILSPDYRLAQGAAVLTDTGIVALARVRGLNALFAADIGTAIEHALVYRYRDALEAELLKAPRHGAKDSTGLALLEAASPRAVVIETGSGGLAGQPSDDVLSRIAMGTDAEVFRTDRDGTIAFFPVGERKFTAYSLP